MRGRIWSQELAKGFPNIRLNSSTKGVIMVSRRQCTILADRFNPSDGILETSIGKTEGRSHGAEEIHNFAKNL